MIQALGFDFDGTVSGSEPHEYETLCEIFAEHGAELYLADLPLPALLERLAREP